MYCFVCKNYFDVKRKKYIKKTVVECGKRVKIFIGLKKTCLGVLEQREERDKDNTTGLKEGGGIEIFTTVLRVPLLRFKYSPLIQLLLLIPLLLLSLP